jgi:hypothetical protein
MTDDQELDAPPWNILRRGDLSSLLHAARAFTPSDLPLHAVHTLRQLCDHIDRLRAELESALDREAVLAHDTVHIDQKIMAEADAEIARLNAALTAATTRAETAERAASFVGIAIGDAGVGAVAERLWKLLCSWPRAMQPADEMAAIRVAIAGGIEAERAARETAEARIVELERETAILRDVMEGR